MSSTQSLPPSALALMTLVLCLASPHGSAAAQTTPTVTAPPTDPNAPPPSTVSEEDAAAAAEAYDRARAAIAAGDNDAAEAAFQEAFDRGEDPAMLMGLAEVRQQRGNVQGTIDALEAYLAARPDAPDTDAVQARLSVLRDEPGTMTIEADPAGEIQVDGELIGRTTPAELSMPGGSYQVTVVRAGQAAEVQTVTVPFGGRVTASFVPPEPPADDALGDNQPLDGPDGGGGEAEAESSGDPSRAVWISASIAAGALLAGTVVGFMALSEESAFNDAPTAASADRGERLALFADVLLGVAGVAAISALVLYFTSRPGSDPEEVEEEDATARALQLSPVFSRRGGGVTAALRF